MLIGDGLYGLSALDDLNGLGYDHLGGHSQTTGQGLVDEP